MKYLLASLVLAVVAANVSSGRWIGFPRRRSLESRDSSATINDYLDNVLNQTVSFLYENNMEPFKLADKYVYDITFKDLLGLKWKTRLGLYDGEAQNLTTLRRFGDAEMSYVSSARTINIEAALTFDKIVIVYNYAAQTLNIGPAGVFTATLNNLTAKVDISVNLRTFKAALLDFELKTTQRIHIGVTGMSLLGNLAVEAFANVFSQFLTGPILRTVQSHLSHAIASSVGAVSPGPISVIVQ